MDDTVEEAVTQPTIGAAFLVRFDFASGPVWLWTGYGRLRTLDGILWDGFGELGQIGGISGLIDTDASEGQMTLSGASVEILQTARGEVSEFTGRTLAIFLQTFDASGGGCIGLPQPISLRIMTTMEASRDVDSRTITLNHEGPYTGRSRVSAGYYTHADQQVRFPGDKAFQWVTELLFQTVTWPDY